MLETPERLPMEKSVRYMLISEEGWRNKAYPDPLTNGAPYTIGVGHASPDIYPGLFWSDDKISQALDADIAVATVECTTRFAPWFQHLDAARQAVLIGMMFQRGAKRVLKFRRALAAMSVGAWESAAAEMLDSTWAKQTPARAKRMADQMRTGEWA
jgi:lysozyme